jgi:hypothetical protein
MEPEGSLQCSQDPGTRQMNPVHTFPPYFPKIHSNIIVASMPRSYVWCLPFRLSHQNFVYEGVSKSFRTGRLEQEVQIVQLCATMSSCIAILWVSLVSFAVITLCVASQRVFVVVYFVIDSVRKLLDTFRTFLTSAIHATWTDHLILLDLITVTVFGEAFWLM